MTVVHLVGGPRNGTTITTSDGTPKYAWFFEDQERKIHAYFTVRYADVDGRLWWVAQYESLDNEQAEHLFTEYFYVPSRRRNYRNRVGQ